MSNGRPGKRSARDLLSVTLHAMFGNFALVGLFSFFCNLAMLVVPLYMLQVYDRVLTSGSTDTLVLLSALAFGLLLLNGLLEVARSRILVRIGAKLDAALSSTLFAATFGSRLNGSEDSPSEPLRDFDKYRSFLTGPGIIALFDAPWTPIYLGIIFLLHPLLGTVALFGAFAITGLALFSEFYIRGALSHAGTAARHSNQFTDVVGRNVEAVHAMGMLGSLTQGGCGRTTMASPGRPSQAIARRCCKPWLNSSECRCRSPSSALGPGWRWRMRSRQARSSRRPSSWDGRSLRWKP